MWKRKRRADRKNTPSSPAFKPYASQMETSSKEKISHSFGSTGVKPMSSSLMNILEGSPNVHHHSPGHHRRHNLNRALLLRLPRHYHHIQHSQRNFGQYSSASTSHGKTTPLRDNKLPLKSGHRYESRSGYHTERREKASRRPDRIRSNTLVIDAVSSDVMKMLCGLCNRILKRKPLFLGSSVSTSDLSVVAVLVCGHVYHADCLETRTPYEDRRDPPCPLCTSSGSAN